MNNEDALIKQNYKAMYDAIKDIQNHVKNLSAEDSELKSSMAENLLVDGKCFCEEMLASLSQENEEILSELNALLINIKSKFN